MVHTEQLLNKAAVVDLPVKPAASTLELPGVLVSAGVKRSQSGRSFGAIGAIFGGACCVLRFWVI